MSMEKCHVCTFASNILINASNGNWERFRIQKVCRVYYGVELGWYRITPM